MSIELSTRPYGQRAAEALRDVVTARKHGDPLAPVTVIVPTNYVGVAARRLLAGGTLGRLTSAGEGVAGVTFLTVYRLAELLGAPRLASAGRRPVSTPVLAAAVRRALANEAGMFAAVAAHPATERSLVEAYRELSECEDDDLDRLAGAGRRAGEVVRVYRAARSHLRADWYDERDLMEAATAAVADGSPVLPDLGAIVLHLPQALTQPAATMLDAIAAVGDVVVIAGTTGATRADAPVRAAVGRLVEAGDGEANGDANGEASGERAAVPHATRVVSASDPDDEVRAAIRLVVDALRDGVPLERMAILYGSAEPYARLVHEQLDAAGIPHNGAAVRTLAESVIGRSLRGLLALGDRDFHRHDVMALLAAAPVHHRGRAVPSARWEQISRAAGVVRGADQWHARLERHAHILERSLAEEQAVPDREPRPERFQRDLDETRALASFVADVQRDLAAVARPGLGWRDLADGARRLVHDYLPNENRRGAWPEREQRAGDEIDGVLERLAGLDSVEQAPGIDVFRATLELEFDAGLARTGRLGEGILMGHVALGLGLDLDHVFVCGLAEGTFPTRVRDDSLLPDADRRATNGALALRSARVDDDHRRLLAALASARTERVLLYPRGDLRRTTERMPSRFLLDSVEALGGERRYADDLEQLRADWFTVVPSFAGGIARTVFPATHQEYRLRTLLDHTRAGAAVGTHELHGSDPALRRGVDCTVARASTKFTRFDGNLSHLTLPSPAADDAVVSPTRLESWARCPFDYFVSYVLRVEIAELPEEVYELSHLDRGSLVHTALDHFLRGVLTRPEGAPAPHESWTAADHDRLEAIGVTLCDEYEAQGITGRRVFWQRDRRVILADLHEFLIRDSDVRAEHRLTTLATELRFGLPGADTPAIDVALSDGRHLRFRGAADRVDRADDGALCVIDYKTGSPPWTVGSKQDPTDAGTRLQLPIYAHAARREFGDAHAPVMAAYWFVTSKREFRWMELELTPEVQTRVDEVLRTVVDGIEGGIFPCAVGPPQFLPWRRRTPADPDGRGTRDRYREWLRKWEAPELGAFVALETSGAEEPGS